MSGRELVLKGPVCDGCGGPLEDGDLRGWVDIEGAVGWVFVEMCAECEGLLDYSLDDEEEP